MNKYRIKQLKPKRKIQSVTMRIVAMLGLSIFMVSTVTEAKTQRYTENDVYFFSGPGLKLFGTLSVPKNCSKSSPCPGIVLAHGPGGYDRPEMIKNDFLMPPISNRLSESGFVTLRFSYRGVGASEGPHYRFIPMEQVEDVQNAITFLQAQDVVDGEQIGLLGLATGGSNASYVAGIDDRVKAMVSVNGMGDLGRWMREIRPYWEWVEFNEMVDEDRINRVLTGESKLLLQRDIIINDPTSRQFRESVESENPEAKKVKNLLSLESAAAIVKFKPEAVVHQISPRAALWIAAEFDTLLPPDHSKIMYQNAQEPKDLIIMKGEEHHSIYHGEGLEKLKGHISDWFVKNLPAK